MSDRSDSKGTRVYVGGLSEGVKKEDLENEFEKFGKLNNVWVAFNPPGFAFIEYTTHSDAETACDNLNGSDFLGSKLRVEIARGTGRRGGFRGARGAPPRRGSSSADSSGGYRAYTERSNGFRGSSRGSSSSVGGGGGGGRGSMGSRDSSRYDEYPREERYGSRDTFARNGDGYRRGARDTFARGRGGSSAGSNGGSRHRFDSNSRFRSRSPVTGARR